MLTPHDIGLPSTFESFRVDPRTSTDQFSTAYDIAQSSKRIQLLGAPPGTGKTIINIAAGVLASSSNYRILYLVSTNSLLEQVRSEFESIGIAPIMGMGNYVCNDALSTSQWSTRTIKCNEGKCLSGYVCDLRNDGCDYHDKVRIARDSKIVLSNFAYRASCAKYSPAAIEALGEFDLVICDEAHLLLDWLTSFCTIILDRRDIKSLLKIILPDYSDETSNPGDELSLWVEWARDNIPAIEQLYCDRRQQLAQSSSPRHKQLDEIKQLGHDLRTLSNISSNDTSKWVVEPFRYGVEITPIDPGEFLERYIYLNTPKVILSSASITEIDAPTYHCGGGYDDDYEFHQGGTGFPVKNRPLIWVKTTTVKHRMPDARVRTWITQIDHLCELGKDYRGIIHSVSYSRMKLIYSMSRHSSNMIIHRSNSGYNARDKSLPTLQQALEIYHSTPPPIILVSPSVGTGYDGKYDRVRWQIISKVPFLNPSSPIVRARKKLWKEKYKLDYMTVMAAKTILQYYGRPVRAIDDWGTTWIVDDPWGKYVSKSRAIPIYVKNAMSTVWRGLPDEVRSPL